MLSVFRKIALDCRTLVKIYSIVKLGMFPGGCPDPFEDGILGLHPFFDGPHAFGLRWLRLSLGRNSAQVIVHVM